MLSTLSQDLASDVDENDEGDPSNPPLLALGQRPMSDVDDLEEVGPYNPLSVRNVGGSNPSVVVASSQETVAVSNVVSVLTFATYNGATRATIAVETASIRFRIDGGAPTTTVGILANPGDVIVLPTQTMMEKFQAIRSTSTTSATIWAIYETGLPGALGFQIIRGQGTDGLGDTNVNLNTLISGEDTSVGVLKVEERFSYANFTGAQTSNVKTMPGFLHAVIVNTPGAGALSLFDGLLGAIPSIGVLAATAVGTYLYDVSFLTALSFTSTAGADVTFSYR